MIGVDKGVGFLLTKHWKMFVVSVAIACGFGMLLRLTINSVLLAGDESIIDFNEGDAVATLSIPRINLETSVFEVGVDDDDRIEVPEDRERVGWFVRGEREGLARFLVGHTPGVFDDLIYLQVGDVIIFNKNGNIEKYEVIDKVIKGRDDISMIDELKSADLLLMTCSGEEVDGNFTDRLIAYAKKL